MKKSLRSFLTVLAVFTSVLSIAQGNGNGNGNGNNGNGNGNGNSGSTAPAPACGVSGVSVEVIGTPTSTANTCTAEVNLYFLAVLAGENQRFVTLNIYNRATYPNVTYSLNDKAPNKNKLGNVLATIVLEREPGNAPQKGWKISSKYGNGSVPVTTAGLTLFFEETPQNAGGLEAFFRNYVYFKVSGLKLTVAGACSGLTSDQFVADVWGSSGDQNDHIVCANKNVSLANCDINTLPTLTGIIDCNNPRSYSISFNNAGNCRPFLVDYQVYLDANGNAVRDASDPQINKFDNDGDILFDNIQVLVPGQTTTATKLRPVQGLNQNLLFVEGEFITPTAGGLVRTPIVPFEIDNSCAALPVKFKVFNVQRDNQKKQQINLSWETAMEQNNAGFQIQRKVGNNWETIAYIPSKAPNGNSNSAIRYQYADNNTFQAVSQYRLQQEDLDGALAYSDVKSVRGIGHVGTLLIYPNPSESGQINLLFSEPGTREVLVSDLSGRIVKQYREVSSTLLTIDGLAGGFYTVKIIDRKTGAVTVEKVVVKKR